jgi:hypothetical protein
MMAMIVAPAPSPVANRPAPSSSQQIARPHLLRQTHAAPKHGSHQGAGEVACQMQGVQHAAGGKAESQFIAQGRQHYAVGKASKPDMQGDPEGTPGDQSKRQCLDIHHCTPR